jgi:RNA 3'-terminal phosphate cyclase (ATP)
MILIDGSQGEGGGQVLRTSLTLSILTGQAFKVINVRANRNPTGLKPQHVAAIKAAAMISDASYKGATVGSSTVYFDPGRVKSGDYDFSIGTAGATGLVLQTVALPLALRGDHASSITVTGGTHVEHSPSFHFLKVTWIELLRAMGISIELSMLRAGFYPRGHGQIRATIQPTKSISGLVLKNHPPLTHASGFSAVADLPPEIANRQTRRMTHLLKKAGIESTIENEVWEGGPGTVAAIVFRQTQFPILFSAVGKRGKPAESVADEAAIPAIHFAQSQASVDSHSADQIVLPLVLANGASQFRTPEVSTHLTTNIETIKFFCTRAIELNRAGDGSGSITID